MEPNSSVPSVYVGESGRSIMERGMEHWKAFHSKKEDSHIYKHHLVHHDGTGEPEFHLRPFGFFRSALARQVAEAVRIRRRGESVLNSKGEYNRCSITRLNLPEGGTEPAPPPTVEPERMDEWRLEQKQQLEVVKMARLDEMYGGVGTEGSKREGTVMEPPSKRNKRWKHEPFKEGWGEKGQEPEDLPII